MKTIVLQEPGKIELTETEAPSSLAEDEVLIQIKRIGICGTDIHAFNGNQPYFTYPRILGHELSGEVVEAGRVVTNVKKGERVTVIPYLHCGDCIACRSGKTNCCTKLKVLGVHIDGGMRELLKLPASHVLPVPQLGWEAAAIVEPLSIGAHAVSRAAIQPGETALVIGAGPIGLGVARFAKLQGAKVIVMDVSVERLEFCQTWAECDGIVLAGDQAGENLLRLNNQEYPTLVLDATGNKGSMMNAFNLVAHGGRLVFVGLVKDQISFSDPDFHARELTLMGSRNATRDDFARVIRWMEEGKVDAAGYISQTVPFAEAAERFADIQANRQLIKAVLSLD